MRLIRWCAARVMMFGGLSLTGGASDVTEENVSLLTDPSGDELLTESNERILIEYT
jgi:hypothetical protein